MSNLSPAPVPMAETRSFSSALVSTLFRAKPSELRILPRSGSTAWVRLLRPCLAEPPALSPSTMNSLRFVEVGRFAIGQLAGQVEAALRHRFALDLAGRLARGQPGLGGQDDAADDLVRRRHVGVEPGFQRRTHEVVDRRRPSPGCSASPWSVPGTSARARTPTGCRRCLRGCPRRVMVKPLALTSCVSM